MSWIIAVVNNKGGVGKTTLTVNLGHALANRKKNVLLVDLDNQCNSTSTFMKNGNVKNTLYELLDDENTNVETCIYPTDYERVYFLPNTSETSALEPLLMQRPDRGYPLLRDRFREYALKNYDVTLLDCPPNLGLFVMQAMITADFVIVPIECGSRYATEGLARTVEAIDQITSKFGSPVRFLRLLINKVDRRTAISRVSIDQVKKSYGSRVFETIIPTNTDIQQAELLGKTVIRHASKSPGAAQFRVLAKELLALLK